MKKVNMFIVSLIFIISEICNQTLKSLKVINTIDDDKNKIGVKKFISKKVANYHYLWTQIKWVYGGRDRAGKIIMLPILPNANPSILACINAPQDKAGRQTTAESIQTKCANITWLTISPLLLSALTPLILALHNAKGKNAIGAAWFALNKKLTKIMQLVQDCMDLHVPDSITICELYGFTVHGKGGSNLQVFEGFSGTVSGTADFIAVVGHRGCCYSWKLWNAAHTTFIRLDPTTFAHCTIKDQPEQTAIHVSYDVILGETTLIQSQIIEVVTK